MKLELDDQRYSQITSLCERGNVYFERYEYEQALREYEKAFELIPRPLEDWEASTWVLTALGDCLFLLGKYKEAKEYLSMAMHCPGGLGNEFIHLRLGQVQFELKNFERAADELARAYMGGGEEIFSGENEKYLTFLRTKMKGI